jgi:hypothetical protein
MVFANPLLDVMLQTLRNPDHLFHFAMRNSSPDVVTAHISLFAECVEGTYELGVLSHREFQRLDDSVVMTVTAGAKEDIRERSGTCTHIGYMRHIEMQLVTGEQNRNSLS